VTDTDTPLTPTQYRLMAYVDDEMPPGERLAFETQLAEDPDLAAQVAEFRSLADFTNSMTLAEPTDHEMQRFWRSFYNRSEWQLGWILVVLGGSVLLGYGLYELMQIESWIIKGSSGSLILGAGLLRWNTIRQKMRTHRLDRYRGVTR
jgi:hypothetical protein